MTKRKTLVEYHNAGAGVVSTPGLIRNIKICGFKSRNAGDGGECREYLPAALEKGVPRYEGAAVYFDHDPHTPVRPVMSKFGKLQNVRFVAGEGLFGDLKYNPKHLNATTFEGWVESSPEDIGFSHAAQVAYEVRDGKEVITEILGVKSVDIVSSPATTKGIFEALTRMEEQVMPDIGAPPVPAEDPAEAAKSHLDYLADLIAAIVRDPAMSGPDKMAKIKNCSKLLDGVSEPLPGSGEGEEEVAEDAPEEGEESEEEAPVEDDDDDEKKDEAFESFAAKFDDHINKAIDARLEALVTKTVTEAVTRKAKDGAKTPVSTQAPVKKVLTVDDLISSIGEVK